MILHLADWFGPDGRAVASVHHNTKNISFLQYAALLRKMGIKNWYFCLALHDESLRDVDPHDPAITPDQALRVANECVRNVWYYLREVVRVPESGGDAVRFNAHRGNMAMFWCYFNYIDYLNIMPRQTGKTMAFLVLFTYVLYIAGYKLDMGMLVPEMKLRHKNVSRIKDIRNELPSYLCMLRPFKDADNKESLGYLTRGTKLMTAVARDDISGASDLGRGFTMPTIGFDEAAFIKNIHITLSILLGSTLKARATAAANNQPHSNIYTTTAGRIDEEEGAFVYDMVTNAMPFSEAALFDAGSQQAAASIVRQNSANDMVNGTFSFLQLGFDHKWLEEAIRITKMTGKTEQINREFLNIWTAGTASGIIPADVLARIRASEREPSYVQMLGTYAINWYKPHSVIHSDAFKKTPLVMGVDASEVVGRDFTSMVIMDARDMSVVGVFRVREANLTGVAVLMANLLLAFPKMVMIPERKSVAAAIIDTVILILRRAGINPLRRIFNYIVNDKLHTVDIDKLNVDDTSERRELGFMTSKATRTYLYSATLTQATSMNASRIYDKAIITELSGLKTINGRVDHRKGAHDDTAIAYLLCAYFCYEAKNVHIYGFDRDNFLSEIESVKDNREKLARQIAILTEIKKVQRAIDAASTDAVKRHYADKLEFLKSELGVDSAITPMALSQLMNELQRHGVTGIVGRPASMANDNTPDAETLLNAVGSP